VFLRRASALVILMAVLSAAFARADFKTAEAAKVSPIQVRHLDKIVDNWKVAETTNFRIMHQQSKPLVDKVGKVAEETRKRLHDKWFGDAAVEYDGRCSIYLHADRAKYNKKAGIPNALGHTRTFSWGRDIQGRSIHLPAEQPLMLEDVLPHEVSHSVLATRFQGKTPRWADEGMAMLAETPAAVAECLGRLKGYKKEHALFGLQILMETEDPEHFQSLEYYSQSASLVQFLTKQKTPREFTSFLHTSISKGYTTALEQHYGIKSFGELDRRWQEFAFPKKK
jgi:hypothetical protein